MSIKNTSEELNRYEPPEIFWYLPNGMNKDMIKVRDVFDCSAKTDGIVK